jgi:hypothetical protein
MSVGTGICFPVSLGFNYGSESTLPQGAIDPLSLGGGNSVCDVRDMPCRKYPEDARRRSAVTDIEYRRSDPWICELCNRVLYLLNVASSLKIVKAKFLVETKFAESCRLQNCGSTIARALLARAFMLGV